MSDDRTIAPRRALLVALVALAAIGVGAFTLITGRAPWPNCAFHELTGLHCPGCGSTRAVLALSRGDVLAALDYNAIAVVLLPFVAYGLGVDAWNFITRRPLRGVVLDPRWVRALVAIWLAFTVARNLPLAPFDRLAP